MRKFIHLFRTQQEFNEQYQNNYTIPWLSAVKGESESTTYNDENYILLKEDHTIECGKKFTVANFSNNTPRIFYKNMGNPIQNDEQRYGGHITEIRYPYYYGDPTTALILTDYETKGFYEGLALLFSENDGPSWSIVMDA